MHASCCYYKSLQELHPRSMLAFSHGLMSKSAHTGHELHQDAADLSYDVSFSPNAAAQAPSDCVS